MPLETTRLLLRPWKESDADELYLYAQNPAIGYPAGWPAHTSVENSRSIIREVLSSPETYAIVLKETGKPIGCIGLQFGHATDLTDDENECELGYWVGEPYWGLGLIPEAANELIRHGFENLDVAAIWCAYYDGNLKSKRVQDKCGFSPHHTSLNVEVPLLGESRTGHVSCLTRNAWMAKKSR